jgi:hypothetical protein
LSNTLDIPRAKASGLVRTVDKLSTRFTGLATAIEQGRITLEHAHAVMAVNNRRIEEPLADIQEVLVELAEQSTFRDFQQHLRSLANLLDQDGSDPESERLRSSLKITYTADGIALNGHLVGSLASLVASALNSTADAMFRSALDAEEEPPGRGVLLAGALVELCRKGIERPNGAAAPAEISLILEADDSDTARTPDEIRVADETLSMFKCDAVWRVVTMNRDGQPLRVGRAQRLATDAQRRAARLRDQQCVFPGCDTPTAWTDLHHVRHWSDGGGTDIENLACLCRRHHSLVHAPGWSIRPDPGGGWTFTTPAGRTISGEKSEFRWRTSVARIAGHFP